MRMNYVRAKGKLSCALVLLELCRAWRWSEKEEVLKTRLGKARQPSNPCLASSEAGPK